MRVPSLCRAMLGSGLALLLLTKLGIAQPAEQKLPEGLRHVPPDAVGFVHIRAGDFLKSPVGVTLLNELLKDREAKKGLQEIERTLDIGAASIESITLLILSQPPRPAVRSGLFPGGGGGFKRAPEMMPVPPPRFENKKVEKVADKEFAIAFLQQPFPGPGGGRLYPYVEQMEVDESYGSGGPLAIATSSKPLDRKKILKSQLFPPGRDAPNGRSVLFLSDRTLMMGEPAELTRYSELMARKQAAIKDRPMQSALALALAAEQHLVSAGGHVPADMRRMLFMPPHTESRLFAAISPLLQTAGGLTLDLGKSIDLTLQFHAPTDVSAENALQAVKSARVLAELVLEQIRETGESGGWKLELEKGIAKALASATIEQKGTTVRAELKMDVTPALMKRFTKEIVAELRKKGDRVQTVNNLKQIGLALHSYHDANKRFPPAGLGTVNDPDGKPLLSWRVAILPYIDELPLYQQFDLTRAWDHPTNKKLIARMPAIYALPGVETREGMTHYRVLVGPQTMFEPGQRITMVGVTDGTSNTIMAVEAKEPTIWTRPDDLPFDLKGPLPKFGVAPEGFNALFGDATVRFIRAGTPDDIIRAYITRNGGEAVPLPD